MVRIPYRLADLPLVVKFAVAPLIAVALMGCLALVGASGMDGMVRQTETIVGRNLEGALLLSGANTALRKADADMYRLLTQYAVAPLSAEQLAERLAALGKQVAAIAATLADFRDRFADDEQKLVIGETLKELTNIQGAVEVVGAMLEIDFASAGSFLAPFQDNFTRTARTIDQLVASARSDSRLRAEGAAIAAHKVVALFTATTIAAVIVVALAAWGVGGNTGRSVGRIAQATLALSKGDTRGDLAALARRDELGAIVDSLVVFREHIVERAQFQQKEDEMRARAEAEKRAALAQVVEAFRASVHKVVEQVAATARALHASSRIMVDAVALSAERGGEAAESSRQASENVYAVAETANALSRSINEVTRQVVRSADSASRARQSLEATGGRVDELADTASRISQIATFIDRIAAMTNLLAMNATIEAARAGEVGKGFAVVAGEVKELATQTTQATGEISGQIGAIQDGTHAVVREIDAFEAVVGELSAIAASVSSAMAEQDTATLSIVANVRDAAERSALVVERLTAVTDSAHAAGEATRSVADAAGHLADLADTLTRSVDDFVARLSTG